MELLNQVKELEELENHRKLASVKYINEDFKSSNFVLQKEHTQK